jgi:hypothetical protein
MRGWRCKCCQCGLVHTWQFRVIGRNVEFRAWRHPRRSKSRLDTGVHPVQKQRDMKIPRNAITRVVICLLETESRRATMFLDEKTVVSACRRFKPRKSDHSVDLVLKLGNPNYREREFIAACKKAGEPLPVKKIQLKYFPVPARKKRKR